jgi:hypothetical protein
MTVVETEQEVCEAAWRKLQPTHIPAPTREIWEEAARGLYKQQDFPNFIGSTDGKHVTLKCPKNSVSQYFSYLQKCSLVLDQSTNSYVQIYRGCGKKSNRGIFEQSEIGRRTEVGTLIVPHNKPLAGQDEPTLHILIGDGACPLQHYLKWLYLYRQAKVDEWKGNYN